MSDIKRQDLPTGLWVVATPIGNLQDLSPRARRALEEADAILCEDTRRTAKLLSALTIPFSMSKLQRFDAHATGHRIEELVAELGGGRNLALVTDAGTPGISDPGSLLVEAAHRAGISVTPVPGPAAPVALLSVAGFNDTHFVFRGFFPRKESDRQSELGLAAKAADERISRIFIWFESPERVQEMLEAIAKHAANCVVFAGKELTKLHEKFFRGSAAEVLDSVSAEIRGEGALGEWCVAIEFPSRTETVDSESEGPQSSEWVKALNCLLDAGVAGSEAARLVSRHFEISKKIVYERSLQILGKK